MHSKSFLSDVLKRIVEREPLLVRICMTHGNHDITAVLDVVGIHTIDGERGRPHSVQRRRVCLEVIERDIFLKKIHGATTHIVLSKEGTEHGLAVVLMTAGLSVALGLRLIVLQRRPKHEFGGRTRIIQHAAPKQWELIVGHLQTDESFCTTW